MTNNYVTRTRSRNSSGAEFAGTKKKLASALRGKMRKKPVSTTPKTRNDFKEGKMNG